MKTYFFLTNYYLPNTEATGMCAHKVAKELASKKNKVFTVCYKDGFDDGEIEGVKVLRVQTPNYLDHSKLQSEKKRKIAAYSALFAKLVHIANYPLRSTALVKKYMKTVENYLKKHTDEKITVVATYTPLEAVFAAYKLKKKCKDRVEAVYYSTDTLSNEQGINGILPLNYRTKKGEKWEDKMFSVYDKIILMECHREHYCAPVYKKFENKISYANFPLLSEFESCADGELWSKDTKRMAYVGTLIKDMRTPDYICKILEQLSKEIKIEAKFVGGGDCTQKVKAYEKKTDFAISHLGLMPHSTAVKYIGTANILLSIGNKESPMAPSKIYEYMSTGKPIIHVYTYEKDPCLEPLQRYSNSLLIKEGTPYEKTGILEFVQNSTELTFHEVEKSFVTSTPQYTADILQ